MLGLGDARPNLRAIGKLIPFEQDDMVKMVEENSGGKKTSDTAANDNSLGHDRENSIEQLSIDEIFRGNPRFTRILATGDAQETTASPTWI